MYLHILCKQITRDLSSETLYFNKMWSLHTDAGNSIHGGQYAKNVYLGETRIVTKLCLRNDPRADAEELQQYFYHSDHLGSASLISDYKGDEYQRIEYTPYGETWIERTDNKGLAYLPYKFTAKELDPETGLYYFGARYLDSKYSTWISTDPALGDYIPQAPINDEARKHNQNLPGMGGIFNHINCNLYAYGANNPVRYIDPDGKFVANMLLGAVTGAAIGFVSSVVVQGVVNAAMGKSVSDIDWKAAGTSALGGAISGAITGGISGVAAVKNAVGAVKVAQKAAQAIEHSKALTVASNLVTNEISTVISTAVDNKVHGRSKEESKMYMKVNCSVAAGSALVSGLATQTTKKVVDEFGRSSYGHLETLDKGGLISTFISGKPNEPIKDISISVGEQILSTVLTETND